MPYTPHTPKEVSAMLDTIGLKNENELFDCIPKELQIDGLNLPDGLDEFTVFSKFKEIASKNATNKTIFMGGGYYDHIIPSAVDALSMRSEFYTAYTPYQAEASQGTLQSLYEYQSLVCALTGMQVSNASMYDGATALAEAALMAVRITKRNKILIDKWVNPTYIKVVQTYLEFRDIDVEVVDYNDAIIDETIAAFLFQNPNFIGDINEFESLIDTLHQNKALAVMSVYPIALGLLKTPGELDVDIVSADGQCLGNYMSFGGPSFGIIATKQKYIRDLPGRIIGKTVDKDDNELFVLTMQAREQHIRRHRATSNICSNQNLLALRSTIFMSLVGHDGFEQLAQLNYSKCEYLKEQLKTISGITIFNQKDTFNEFVIKIDKDVTLFLEELSKKDFYAGINLGKLYDNLQNCILISVTEKRTKEQMDNLVAAIKELV